MIYARVNRKTKRIYEYPVNPSAVVKWLGENNVSISGSLYETDLRDWGWYGVEWVPIPKPTQIGHKVVLDYPRWEGDTLIRTFKEVPRTEKETVALWEEVREKRNKLLDDTDWVELPSVKKQKSEQWIQDWITYRKALRNITNCPDPLMIDWPEKPNE